MKLNKSEVIEGLRVTIRGLAPTHIAFYAFNQGAISHEYGRRALELYFKNLQRKIAGKYYWQRPEDWIRGIAIPETWYRNSHYNCYLWVPPHLINRFESRAERFWRRETSKTARVRRIFDLEGALNYGLKSVEDPNHYNNIVFLSDLLRS